ncbi:MAG: SAM-dependent methyltransferase, partial [Thiomonas sp.]
GFEQGWISLFQVLGSHPDGVVEARQEPATTLRAAQSEYPFNREYIYTQAANQAKPKTQTPLGPQRLQSRKTV